MDEFVRVLQRNKISYWRERERKREREKEREREREE